MATDIQQLANDALHLSRYLEKAKALDGRRAVDALERATESAENLMEEIAIAAGELEDLLEAERDEEE